MPTHYKSFAVVGGGTLGLPIVAALAAKNVSVVLLSRPGSGTKAVPSGVPIIQVDYTDAAAVGTVFKQHGVDVVLSTINALAASSQKPLVDAAKLASVKLFVPAEYGMPTEGHTAGALGAKNGIAEYLKTIGIPSVRIYTGLFTESVLWLVGYSDHGKFRILGKGDKPVSFVSVPDIAGFVAHVLTTLSPAELENQVFRLEGERASLNELAAQLDASVEHVDSIEGDSSIAQTALLTILESGAGSTGWDTLKRVEGTGAKAAGSANALWPGHKWQTVKDVHNL
ncbi:hypothetical protein C8R43DRAFT_873581 [Mycena crocata]|nr:hypothetical protein C8R43DRAFT_873581 [Mycena crocata]